MLIYSSSISFSKNLKIHKKSLEPINIPASEYDKKDKAMSNHAIRILNYRKGKIKQILKSKKGITDPYC